MLYFSYSDIILTYLDLFKSITQDIDTKTVSIQDQQSLKLKR